MRRVSLREYHTWLALFALRDSSYTPTEIYLRELLYVTQCANSDKPNQVERLELKKPLRQEEEKTLSPEEEYQRAIEHQQLWLSLVGGFNKHDRAGKVRDA